MGVLSYITTNNLSLLSSMLLVVFTGVLAYYTYYLYLETKRSRRHQVMLNQPELSVIFEPSKKYINFIYIKIKNIGGSPLYNLELEKVENDFICFNGKKISELSYLKKTNYLRPNQEIEQFFISFTDDQNKPKEMEFSLLFRYKGNNGKLYKKKFDFDFNQFYDMSQLGEDPIYQIAKNIEKIERNFSHFATGFKKLQVITQTKLEKTKEEKEQLKKVKSKINLVNKAKKNDKSN